MACPILKLEGMKDYVFMRPGPSEKQLPANLFWWQGIDGTKALAFRIPYSYNDFGDVRDHMLQEIQLLHGQNVRDDMEFYGVGDHGGGPTKVGIRSIERIQGEKGAPFEIKTLRVNVHTGKVAEVNALEE